jgi:cytochrome c oxidase subunit 2
MESFAPVTPQGQAILRLFQVALAISALILLVVYAVLVVVLRRDRGRPGDPDPPQTEGNRRLEVLWTATPALILLVMFVLTVGTMRAVSAEPPPGEAMRIQVTGRQWWWEFAYPEQGVITANELHVPVGVPLRLEVTGGDVVHSFWVPQLGWKRDAVPGKTNIISVTVDEPGTYEGACSEFCGVQHAWMRIRLVAEPGAQFQAWIAAQRQPAGDTGAAAGSSLVGRGQQVFLNSTCVACHRVAGTPANGQVGPDLTHFASRATIGAGVAPNTPDTLRRWVQDARAIKPGVLMPSFAFSGDDLDALVAYLQSLR